MALATVEIECLDLQRFSAVWQAIENRRERFQAGAADCALIGGPQHDEQRPPTDDQAQRVADQDAIGRADETPVKDERPDQRADQNRLIAPTKKFVRTCPMPASAVEAGMPRP